MREVANRLLGALDALLGRPLLGWYRETIQYLGAQSARFRTAEVGCYNDMVRSVCSKLDWDSERFRGFRCRVEYPIFGAQVSMIFKPPDHKSVE